MPPQPVLQEPSELVPVLLTAKERYAILGTVGEGSTAVVFKAHDLELDEVIALKVLSPAVARDAAVMERLKREIKIARRIRHPNVARVYDLEEWEGRLCISMEYIEGDTLGERLRPGPMPWGDAVPILTTIALALESAHALGVVHRDLKPANIVLDSHDHPYVLDFGIALGPGHGDTGARVIRGSPAYMAPERWRGVPGIVASDLYSLGVVAYEMIGGAPPYKATSVRLVMSQHLHSRVPDLRALVSGAPTGLYELVTSLLAKLPEDRPRSASEVLQRLRRLTPHHRLPRAADAAPLGTILVIDDDASVRRLLAQVLRTRGAQVIEAEDGTAGLARAIADRPDLIFLDLSMPGLDGVSTLRAIKAVPEMASRPVIILSGSADPAHPELSRGLGAVAFLNKPVNSDVLDLVLDKYLA